MIASIVVAVLAGVVALVFHWTIDMVVVSMTCGFIGTICVVGTWHMFTNGATPTWAKKTPIEVQYIVVCNFIVLAGCLANQAPPLVMGLAAMLATLIGIAIGSHLKYLVQNERRNRGLDS